MNRLSFIAIFLLTLISQFCVTESAQSQNTQPWCTILQLSGNNYWRTRLPVDIENTSERPLEGSRVQIQVSTSNFTSELSSEEAGRIRITDPNGDELLFDCVSGQGNKKHEGKIEAGDILILPVTVPGNSTGRFYIYSGNPDAWPIPDLGDFKWTAGRRMDIGCWLRDQGI